MKNAATLGLLFLFMLTFSACRKYEDNPLFSLRLKKTRLIQEWVFFDTQIDGAYGSVSNYTLTFERDGDVLSAFDRFVDQPNPIPNCTHEENFVGTWEWNDRKGGVTIARPNMPDLEVNITKLTMDELWIEYSDYDPCSDQEARWDVKFYSN